MIATLAPVSALLLSVVFLLMGNGLQGTLLPVRAQLELFSTTDIGILGSFYFLGFAAGCYLGPLVVRRAGHIRTFAAMVSLASTATLVHVLVLEPVFWWPVRAITGFCFAVLYMVIESWLNEKSTNETRGTVFSIYTVINLFVLTVGQMMLTLADPKAFPLFAVASILVSIAALPVALTKSPALAPIASVQIRIRYLFKSSPVGVVGALVVGFANGSFWSLAPVFAQSNSAVAGTSGIATFMSISVIAGAMAQWPFGWLSDRIDRRKVIVIVCVGAAAMGIGMAVLGQRWENAAYVFSFLFGLFAFPLYAICAAHMNDSVEEGGFVEAAGGLLLLYGTGAVIGPILASASMRLVGGEGLYFFTAVAHMAMAGFAIYRLGRRERRPEAEREPFADSVRIAQTVATIDPLPEALAKED